MDGLIPDHLQYAWPGPVTQSVEQAFFADRYGKSFPPPGHNDLYSGSDLKDPESPSGRRYTIAAISFDDVFDAVDHKWYPTLVVKPCPRLETGEVRSLLHAIADQAMDTYGHYRFYCYTNATIADDANRWGPAIELADLQPLWDSAAQKWTDWSDADNPGGKPLRHAPSTAPSVCFSFVWQAIQDVNKARVKDQPGIVLDWAKDHDQALGTAQLTESGGAANAAPCQRAVAPDWDGDFIDDFTADGLYTYPEAQRETAGKWLADKLEQKVFDQLKAALKDMGGLGSTVAGAIDALGRAGFITAAEAGAAALIAAISLIPVVGEGIALALADFDANSSEQLVELLYDMPTDIANQVCNSFAFDCHRGAPGDLYCVDAAGNLIRDVDSDNWASAAGVGRAVSPDNIHMFWDAPGPSTQEIQRGLYGYNTPAQLVAAVIRRPVCKLVPVREPPSYGALCATRGDSWSVRTSRSTVRPRSPA
jgi:hypothetical protein